MRSPGVKHPEPSIATPAAPATRAAARRGPAAPGEPPVEVVVRLEDLRKTYYRGKTDVPVLKGISLEIDRGEMVALMGSSGSGKTTLINVLGSLDQPTGGHCWIDNDELSQLSEPGRASLRNQRIGFVFQNFNLLPRLTALENVMMPLTYSSRDTSGRERRRRAKELLERMGLAERMDHFPSQLSGGQQQRVAIARALINNPDLLIADEPTGNLDSRTSEEVLDVFRKLNVEQGLTILLVTHDPAVAEHADRTIRIRDGLLESDGLSPASATHANGHAEGFEGIAVNGNGRSNGHPHGPKPSPAPVTTRSRPRRTRRHGNRRLTRSVMGSISMALRSIRRNAFRSTLTTLGVIIGVASLIVITEIGKGSSTAVQRILMSMGANNLLVQPGAASRNGISLGSGSYKTLTPDDAEAIIRECPAVVAAAPIIFTRQQVVHGGRNWIPFYIFGTTPAFLRVREWEDLALGEAFTPEDVEDAALVCLLGNTVANELFGDESPVGKEVLVNGVPLRVRGVLEAKGANIIGDDQDDILLAPWTTVKFRISGAPVENRERDLSAPAAEAYQFVDPMSRRYPRTVLERFPGSSPNAIANTPQLARFSNVDSILARSYSAADVPQAQRQMTELLRERHHIEGDDDEDFHVQEFTEITRAVHAMIGLITGMLIGAALISLAVGGVGIMNIMLVSVSERYHEIGLRMAVGAASRDILLQFLIEAIVLSLLGGLIGIFAGRGGAMLLARVTQWPIETSVLAIVGSVSVSVTVGIVFGYYPAWKASRLNPIEALRYE
jgi:macrolide transport system ATP-binding/permease protein